MDMNTVTDRSSAQSIGQEAKATSKVDRRTMNLPELKVAADAAKAAGIAKEDFEPKTEKEKEKLKDAITIANNSLKMQRTQLQFAYHEKINKVSIKVIDSSTMQVVKEIPPEKTLKALERLYEIPGLMMDKKI